MTEKQAQTNLLGYSVFNDLMVAGQTNDPKTTLPSFQTAMKQACTGGPLVSTPHRQDPVTLHLANGNYIWNAPLASAFQTYPDDNISYIIFELFRTIQYTATQAVLNNWSPVGIAAVNIVAPNQSIPLNPPGQTPGVDSISSGSYLAGPTEYNENDEVR